MLDRALELTTSSLSSPPSFSSSYYRRWSISSSSPAETILYRTILAAEFETDNSRTKIFLTLKSEDEQEALGCDIFSPAFLL